MSQWNLSEWKLCYHFYRWLFLTGCEVEISGYQSDPHIKLTLTFSKIVKTLVAKTRQATLRENPPFVDAHTVRATFDVTLDVRSKSAVRAAGWRHWNERYMVWINVIDCNFLDSGSISVKSKREHSSFDQLYHCVHFIAKVLLSILCEEIMRIIVYI